MVRRTFKSPFLDFNYMKTSNNKNIGFFRIITSPLRVMPNFIIIGVHKGGTTSLYNYLIQHPYIAPARIKEPNFFNRFFHRGLIWYRAHFTTIFHVYSVKVRHGHSLITGEASINYLWHPDAPKRILQTIPNVKLIILLRNPVDRAYSHYQMQCRIGRETFSFEEAIAKEEERISGEMEKMIVNEKYHSKPFGWYAYLSKGKYADQLEDWFSKFPREQFLILNSEDFFANPSETIECVCKFLKLPSFHLSEYKQFKAGNYQDINASTRKHLQEYFRSHNERLAALLNMDLNWDK